MTKEEAIAEMVKGIKVTHEGFSSEEWMTMEGGKVVLEDGVKCPPHEFWRWRTEYYWNDGYSLYKD